jgi:ABC-2 type transport system ATP-binding protein
MVRLLVGEGATVLLTTQYLDEADHLADRIAIIDRGTLIAEGTSSQLKASVGAGRLHVRISDPNDRATAERILVRLDIPVVLDADPAALSARIPFAAGETVARALTELSRADVTVTEFALGQPSLDEVFLALTGHPAAAPHTDEPDAHKEVAA